MNMGWIIPLTCPYGDTRTVLLVASDCTFYFIGGGRWFLVWGHYCSSSVCTAWMQAAVEMSCAEQMILQNLVDESWLKQKCLSVRSLWICRSMILLSLASDIAECIGMSWLNAGLKRLFTYCCGKIILTSQSHWWLGTFSMRFRSSSSSYQFWRGLT